MPRKPYYGIIGNGETCALISPKGSIEWLCLPRFDGKIVYSKALDPTRGEAIEFKILENGKEPIIQNSSQRYISRTAVLQTLLRLGSLSAEITDFMPFNQESIFRTNQRKIFRIIKIKNVGDKERIVEIKVYSGISSEKHKDVHHGIFFSDKIFLGMIPYSQQQVTIPPRKEAKFSFAIVYGTTAKETEKEIRKLKDINPEKELQSCVGFWVNWFDRGKHVWFENRDFANIYHASLTTIKLLIYHKTGAMLAAPTASFPATPGGLENWDYRYAWIRDCYFAMRALLRSGHYDEVEKMLKFFYGIHGRNGHWESPIYTSDGKKLGEEVVVEEMTGPNEEDQIRLGNAASKQLQLDSEGSVLHATYLYYLFTGEDDILRQNWKKIKKASDWISKNYSRKENGIWESRDKIKHYTYGKVMCYVGLESASKIANILGKKDGWKSPRERLKKLILKNAWSEQRQAFLQTFDKDAPIDISVLALEDYGIVRPDDSRMKKTVRLMEQKLVKNSAVLRYEDATLPFYLPTLWLVSHYIRTDNKDRAEELLQTCINSSTDLCLVAEHFDPQRNLQHGNFPQAFNSAMFIEQLLNMKERKSMLHMLNIFDPKFDDLRRILYFNKHKLVEGAEKAIGLK
ncbi:MAG: glycoside hydrolase family 15 protein [Candidatus Aenigmarchaeota archaeon]|nr:glycoside hydrolase family 15 protein [Candidatus Aenigmarchaeota archaeon]